MSHEWITKQDFGDKDVSAGKAKGIDRSKLKIACPGTK